MRDHKFGRPAGSEANAAPDAMSGQLQSDSRPASVPRLGSGPSSGVLGGGSLASTYTRSANPGSATPSAANAGSTAPTPLPPAAAAAAHVKRVKEPAAATGVADDSGAPTGLMTQQAAAKWPWYGGALGGHAAAGAGFGLGGMPLSSSNMQDLQTQLALMQHLAIVGSSTHSNAFKTEILNWQRTLQGHINPLLQAMSLQGMGEQQQQAIRERQQQFATSLPGAFQHYLQSPLSGALAAQSVGNALDGLGSWQLDLPSCHGGNQMRDSSSQQQQQQKDVVGNVSEQHAAAQGCTSTAPNSLLGELGDDALPPVRRRSDPGTSYNRQQQSACTAKDTDQVAINDGRVTDACKADRTGRSTPAETADGNDPARGSPLKHDSSDGKQVRNWTNTSIHAWDRQQ